MLIMADEAQNKQAMKEAIDTLNLIVSTNSTPKTVKNLYFLPFLMRFPQTDC